METKEEKMIEEIATWSVIIDEQNFLIEELIKAIRAIRMRAEKAEKELKELKNKITKEFLCH